MTPFKSSTTIFCEEILPRQIAYFARMWYNTAMKDLKLRFGLVPDGCWRANLRSALPKALWDKLRKAAYARAGGRCAVCGRAGRLEAHEVWEYDDEKHIQKLAGIIAVCPACHQVIHIGRTSLLGKEKEAQAHFMKVNGCTQSEYHAALGEANRIHAERSRHEWTTDLSALPSLLACAAEKDKACPPQA